jgi:hypothetical protein
MLPSRMHYRQRASPLVWLRSESSYVLDKRGHQNG